MVGISIGAINAALIVGNPPERRTERLREFWELVSAPAPFVLPGVMDFARPMMNRMAFASAVVFGIPGFFAPRVPPPFFAPEGTLAALSFYDTEPLRATLEKLVDFDRINAGDVRLSLGSTNARTGESVYFDTTTHRISASHVMASGALPPGFPPVEVDGEYYFDGGKLRILQEGKVRKFVAEVEHRTFSGPEAVHRGLEVIYITERCVFRLCPEGLELTEIAPGVDLRKDILDQMDFAPVMRREPALMDADIFRDEAMGLRPRMLEAPMRDRLSYDPAKNLFFVNFEGLEVRGRDDIERIRQAVDDALAPVGHKVDAIVNYDRFSIVPERVDDYIATLKGVVERHYHEVSRYASNAFQRVRIGAELEKRKLASQIYETASEAEASLPAGGQAR